MPQPARTIAHSLFRAVAVLVCTALAVGPAPALAKSKKRKGKTQPSASAPPFVVEVRQPSGAPVSFLTLSAAQGQTANAGTLLIRNRTARPVQVALDPVDSVTATNLGSAYQVAGLKIHGPTKWTQLPKRLVTVGRNGQATVPVSVQVPKGAGPGDYLS